MTTDKELPVELLLHKYVTGAFAPENKGVIVNAFPTCKQTVVSAGRFITNEVGASTGTIVSNNSQHFVSKTRTKIVSVVFTGIVFEPAVPFDQ
ncbi:hypothetical protein D3C86_1826350 [compost metagenome]